MSINRAIIIGNLGDDPEVRVTQTGKEVARLRIATNERFTDKDGNRQDRTDWHNVVIFTEGLIDKIVKPYLNKGTEVCVEGAMRANNYEKDGVKRYTTDIVAYSLFMTGRKPKSK